MEKELRDHMYLSMIGSGVGGALFIFTIIILGVMTKMCQWRKSRKKARFLIALSFHFLNLVTFHRRNEITEDSNEIRESEIVIEY